MNNPELHEQLSAAPTGRPAACVAKPQGFRNTQDLLQEPETGAQGIEPQELAATIADETCVAKPQAFRITHDPPAASNQCPAEVPEFPLPAPLAAGGRPTVMTPQIQEQLCLLLSLGLSRRQAASYLAIDASVISRAIARDEELAINVHRAEELCTLQPLKTVIGESRKNWRAAAWLLEHKRKHPPALSEAEKDARDCERLDDYRRQLAVGREMTLLEEESREILGRARRVRAAEKAEGASMRGKKPR